MGVARRPRPETSSWCARARRPLPNGYGTAQTTIEISGSIVQVVSGGTPPTRTTTLATTGTTFTSTDTCPDAVVSNGSFTATATTFAIFLDDGADDAGARTVVETFTKE